MIFLKKNFNFKTNPFLFIKIFLEECLRRYSFGIFCDYLPECLETILKNKLQIKDQMAFIALNPIFPKKKGDKECDLNVPQKVIF